MDVGLIGVGNNRERIIRREQRGEGDVVWQRSEDVGKGSTQLLGCAGVTKDFFEMGKEGPRTDAADFIGENLRVFLHDTDHLIRRQRRFARDPIDHDLPIEMEQDFAEIEADGADFHAEKGREIFRRNERNYGIFIGKR